MKVQFDPGLADTRVLQHQDSSDPNARLLMASSEVDQKFLGQFARQSNFPSPLLSSFLYKVLGLSVILSKKLVRARRLRKLDTTRDTKSLQLYHHIIWLSREGLIMVENYIIPMVSSSDISQSELKVLAYKLRASFYHIFVLFHNQPSIHQTAIPSFSPTINTGKGMQGGNKPTIATNADDESHNTKRSSIRTSPNPFEGGPVQPVGLPPGLAPVSIPKPSAAFLLPATDYVPRATACFTEASAFADALLSGSHPVRLSVKMEFAAYTYDCLHDSEGSRRLASQAIKDVYMAQEGMDDDMFEDAAEMVQILGRMVKRGMAGSSVGSSTPRMPVAATEASSPSTPRATRLPPARGEAAPDMPVTNGRNGVERVEAPSPVRKTISPRRKKR
ncbi:MAG: hypothetical protein Q9220_006193 [cf. Caloplaca sp. 1 TL-2023]